MPDKIPRVGGRSPSGSAPEDRDTLATAAPLRLARAQLAIAKQMLEISRKQKETAASLSDREAVGYFLALADERQRQMDRFDQIQKARSRSSSSPAGEEPQVQVLRELDAATQGLFQETARIDAVTLKVLENNREAAREKLEKIWRGREALRTYTPQNPTADAGGAFIDRSR